MLKVKIFTEISEELITEWEELWNASSGANMVNSPYWLMAAQKAFGNKELKILAIYSEDKLDAITALVRERVFGVWFWTVAAREFADKPSVLVDYNNHEVAKLFFSELCKLGNILLTELDEKQTWELAKFCAKETHWQNDVNPYIDFSKGVYGDFHRRKRNNLFSRLETGKINCRLETTNDEKSLSSIEDCFRIDTTSLKQAKGKGVFYRKDVRIFYKTLVEKTPAHAPVSILYFDNKPVSYLIGFLVNGVYQAAQKAFLTGYEFFNPGKLLMIKLMDFYNENGNPAIELGRGTDRFKRDFAKEFYALNSVIISDNPLVRLYISNCSKLRMKVYEMVYKNVGFYKTYKRLMNLVGKN